MNFWDVVPFINLGLLISLAVWTRHFVLRQEAAGIDRLQASLPELVIEALLARAEWREMRQAMNDAEVRLRVIEEQLEAHLDQAEPGGHPTAR